MSEPRPNVKELAAALIGSFPKLDAMKRRVALATYRRLALGQPVPLGEIGAEAGVAEVIERAEPSSPVVSFLAPEASRFQQDVIKNFCHYVHFFRSLKDGEAWVARSPGTFLLSLGEAFELARRKNEMQFGAALSRPQVPS